MAYFGTLCSPFEMEEWIQATGLRPDFPMIFEHWDAQRPLDYVFAKAKDMGFTKMMLTWEPWTPPPQGLGNEGQGSIQPQWSNDAIIAGNHDAYIRLISKNIRESGLQTVYVRWGHEMNGNWHPWSINPDSYVKAFQRIVNTFRGGGTTNARFIWSPNSSLYQDPVNFTRGVLPYWPGKAYADYVGLTMINFGGEKDYQFAQYVDRFKLMSQIFGRPLFASEVNAAWSSRYSFFNAAKSWIVSNNMLAGFVLSQPPVSRGQQNGITAENMQWSLIDDSGIRDAVGGIATALHASALT